MIQSEWKEFIDLHIYIVKPREVKKEIRIFL